MKRTWQLLYASLIFAIPILRPVVPSKFQSDYNWVIVIAVVLFVINQLSTVLRPVISKESLYRNQGMLRVLLTTSCIEMARAASAFGSKLAPHQLRASIMLPVRKRFIFQRRKIRIVYCTGAFSNEELGLEWAIGPKHGGVCGQAMRSAQPAIFDSSAYLAPKESLNSHQMNTTGKSPVQSILSIPIPCREDENRIVGVLNFDSDLKVDETLFNKHEVILQALREAEKLAFYLPSTGYVSR
jgi:hypothetical protein